MELSKLKIAIINLVLIGYAAFGIFSEYGQNKGGWIIGSMIVLVYVTIGLCFTLAAISNLIKKV